MLLSVKIVALGIGKIVIKDAFANNFIAYNARI